MRRLSASKVLGIQLVLAVVTIAFAWLTGWQAAIVGLVLMHLITVGATLGPWGAPPPPPPPPAPAPNPAPNPAPATKAQLARLEQRVDGLGTRLVASTERLRVEVLDALSEQPATTPRDRP